MFFLTIIWKRLIGRISGTLLRVYLLFCCLEIRTLWINLGGPSPVLFSLNVLFDFKERRLEHGIISYWFYHVLLNGFQELAL